MALISWLLASLPLLAQLSDDELMQLASRTPPGLDWSLSWEEAAARARAEEHPIVVLFTAVPVLEGADAASLQPFSGEDVRDLVLERFVPMRCGPKTEAPFRSEDSYGMGPMAFGTSVLVVTADGSVVGDTFTLEATTLFAFLAEQARRHDPPRPPPPELEGTELAAWHVRRGEEAEALALLDTPSSAQETLLLARLHTRARRGPEALAALEAGREAGVPAADLACAEARVLARLGRARDMLATLDQVPTDHPRAAEATALRLDPLLVLGQVDEALAVASGLVRDHADTRWAQAGAMALVSRAALPGMEGQPLGWPSEETLAMLDLPPFEKTTSPDLSRDREAAARFLVATQRDDGSWPNGFEVFAAMDPRRFPLSVATTALCTRALLPRHEDPEVAPAIRRAFAFLREARLLVEREGDAITGFAYAVWSKAAQLQLLAEALALDLVEPDDWRPAMEGMVAELRTLQKPGGGWTYYPTEEDFSFSFVTAYVLLGLDAARDAGVDVPAGMSDAALATLIDERLEDGRFPYTVVHGEGSPPRPTEGGSEGRWPLCTLALLAWDRTDVDDVRRALDGFLRYRGVYAREHGKTLMHCGPGGEGSHYLLFDYAHAAAACAALPPEDRAPYRAAVIDQIRSARLANGAYLDNPILGDRYGAGMALWSLEVLARQE